MIERIKTAARNLADRAYGATSRLSVDGCVRTLENVAKGLESTAASLNARANRRYDAASRLDRLGDQDTEQAERAMRVLKRLDDLLA